MVLPTSTHLVVYNRDAIAPFTSSGLDIITIIIVGRREGVGLSCRWVSQQTKGPSSQEAISTHSPLQYRLFFCIMGGAMIATIFIILRFLPLHDLFSESQYAGTYYSLETIYEEVLWNREWVVADQTPYCKDRCCFSSSQK